MDKHMDQTIDDLETYILHAAGHAAENTAEHTSAETPEAHHHA
jgi:hypothetical protein